MRLARKGIEVLYEHQKRALQKRFAAFGEVAE
jgi:hypothetical protein